MNALITNMAEQRSRELREDGTSRRLARRARRARTTRRASGVVEAVAIRRLGAADADGVIALAQRDSAGVPAGEMLGAELDGRLIAAVSIATGQAIADPFVRTDDVVVLLEHRVAQIRAAGRGEHGHGNGIRHRLSHLAPHRS